MSAQEPQFTCQLCDAKAYPAFLKFEELEGWCTHNFQREGGSFFLVTCPDCSSEKSDLLQDRWLFRLRSGEIEGIN
jgi:Zn finger protein HypA/HybF involved in hydrogenase expression